MIHRARSFLGTLVLFGLLTGTEALAMGGRQPSSTEKSGSIAETQGNNLQKTWVKVETAMFGDVSALDPVVKNFESALADARKAEGEASSALASVESDRAKEQDFLDSLNLKIRELDRMFVTGTLAATERDKRLKDVEILREPGLTRLEELRRQSGLIRAELAKAQDSLAQLREQILAHAKKIGEQELDFKTASTEEVKASFARLKEVLLRDRRRVQLEQGVNELTERVKRDALKTDFMVTELGFLKRQYATATEKLEGLRRSVEHRLDDTVIGNYIQLQIKKALSRASATTQSSTAVSAAEAVPPSGDAAWVAARNPGR